LIFNPASHLSAGCALTLRTCEKLDKQFLILRDFALDPSWITPLAARVQSFLAECQPQTLNIAGNREESEPGLGIFVQKILAKAWQLALKADVSESTPAVAAKKAIAQPTQRECQGELFSRPPGRTGSALHR
jgi:hypothetical protein